VYVDGTGDLAVPHLHMPLNSGISLSKGIALRTAVWQVKNVWQNAWNPHVLRSRGGGWGGDWGREI